MSMGKSLDEFARRLTDSTLATAAEVADWRKESQAANTEQFARWLVRQRKLTAYQAQQVYAGKGRALVLGNYVILDKLGQGGMGIVLKAEHRRMKRLVALKVVAPAVVKNSDLLQRFQREVQAAARLVHPNIVQAYDADEVRGTHFLVLEYVPGTDLDSLVKKQGPLPVDQALNCLLQAARGLEYAHQQGVIHRDIKPSNLLLDEQGQVKVLDMGLARLMGEGDAADGLTGSGTVMGTVDYMAPEQAENTHTAGAPADIYSLGCTLHFLLTGRPVYTGEHMMQRLLAHRDQPIPSLRDLRPEVPADIDAMFRRMIAKSPQERYSSMSEVIAALEASRSGSSVDGALVPAGGASEDTMFAAFLEGLDGGTAAGAATLQARLQATTVDAPTDTPTVLMTDSNVDTDTQITRRAATSRRRSSVHAAGPLWTHRWLWFGAVGVVVLGGFIITIVRKDGTTETIQVPQGATVTIAREPTPQDPGGTTNANHAAAEWVVSVGGRATLIDWKGTSVDVQRATLPPGDWELAAVNFLGSQKVTDGDLQRLAGCARLHTLDVSSTPLTGTGLTHLQTIATLRHLTLTQCKIHDETAESLASLPQLTSLNLMGTTLTDRGMSAVGRLTQLEQLHLGGVDHLTDVTAEHLRPLTRLHSLAIGGTRISDTGLSQLLAGNPELEGLDLGPPDDEAPVHTLAPLVAARSLRDLTVSGSLLTADAVPVLLELPRLEHVRILYPVTAVATTQFSRVTNVRSLELFLNLARDPGPGDAGYEALGTHPMLTHLRIHGGGRSPSDSALESIAKLPKLQQFTLQCSDQYQPRNYTSAGIEAFHKARPDVHLHVDGQDYPAASTAAGD
jgi:hypothetical protein